MKIPVAKGFSIWLMFSKDYEIELQLIIDSLSKEFKSFTFKPHLTLIPGFEDKDNLLKKFADFVEGLSLFELMIKDVKYSNEFYKSLFFEVEKSEILINLFSKACKTFNFNTTQFDFSPHISLLYTNSPLESKKTTALKFQNLIPKKILVDKISLVRTVGLPEDWKELITADIR